MVKNFKTKKKSLYHLGNFNSPLLLQTPPRTGPRVRYYLSPPQRLPLGIPIKISIIEKIESARGTMGLLFASFFLVVESCSTLFPLPLFCPGFCQFGDILMRCAIVLLYRASVKHMSSKGVLPRTNDCGVDIYRFLDRLVLLSLL